MALISQKKVWESLAEFDPMWAILTDDQKKGRKWSEEEFFKNGRIEIETLITELDTLNLPLGRKQALDFGCGIGRLSQALSLYWENVVGVDISSEMISVANKSNRFSNKCKYIVNEASDLRIFQDNFFDFIYSNIVLQHIAPKYSKKYIEEFIRVAKPGGTIIFQLPYHIHWRQRIQWRRRVFSLLQFFQISGSFIIEKLGINPMRMASIPEEDIKNICTSNHASIIKQKKWSDGIFGSCRYIITKNLG